MAKGVKGGAAAADTTPRHPEVGDGREAGRALLVVAETLHLQVYNLVRERILSGNSGFTPGARLSLDTMADELGVSVTPVKEALKRLQSEGLVILEPRRGSFVATLTEEEIEEIIQVRQGLEMLAFALRAKRPAPVHEARIEAALGKWKKALEEGDVVEASASHYEYHKALVSVSGNPMLAKLHEHLLARAVVFVAYTSNQLLLEPAEFELHVKMGRAIQTVDEARFAQYADEHYQRARRVKEVLRT